MQKMKAPILIAICPLLKDRVAAVLLDELVLATTVPVAVDDALDASAINCERDGSVTPALEQSVLA
jgi:hypothetical protein